MNKKISIDDAAKAIVESRQTRGKLAEEYGYVTQGITEKMMKTAIPWHILDEKVEKRGLTPRIEKSEYVKIFKEVEKEQIDKTRTHKISKGYIH